jgi:hypothetical protein
MELHRQVKLLLTHCEELQSRKINARTFDRMVVDNQKAVKRLAKEASKYGYVEDPFLLPKAALSKVYYRTVIYYNGVPAAVESKRSNSPQDAAGRCCSVPSN